MFFNKVTIITLLFTALVRWSCSTIVVLRNGDNDPALDSTSGFKANIDVVTLSSNVKTELKYPSPIPSSISLAYFGNSMQYVNNCPDLLSKMIVTKSNSTVQIKQQFCLEAGAKFSSMWGEWGYGDPCPLLKKFIVPVNNSNSTNINPKPLKLRGNHNWDFVILNDQSITPAREWSRQLSVDVVREKFAPLLLRNSKKRTIPVIIQTAAYQLEGVQGSDDLGDFYSFTEALSIGVHEYAKAFNEVLLGTTASSIDIEKYGARIAPVGEAYRDLRDSHRELYDKLYLRDHYHPSPLGTWLQACIIFIVCFGQSPPLYESTWMPKASMTFEESEVLRSVAHHITGLSM